MLLKEEVWNEKMSIWFFWQSGQWRGGSTSELLVLVFLGAFSSL